MPTLKVRLRPWWHTYEETRDGSAPGLWALARFLHRKQLPGEKEKNVLAGCQPRPVVPKAYRPNAFRPLAKGFFSFSPALETHGAQKRAKAHSPGLLQDHARVSFIVSGFPAYSCLSGGTGFQACGTRGETPRLQDRLLMAPAAGTAVPCPYIRSRTARKRITDRLHAHPQGPPEALVAQAFQPVRYTPPAAGTAMPCPYISSKAGGARSTRPSYAAIKQFARSARLRWHRLSSLFLPLRWHRLSSLWDAGRDAPPTGTDYSWRQGGHGGAVPLHSLQDCPQANHKPIACPPSRSA